MARKVLKRAVVALRDKGQTPPGIAVEEQRVRSVSKLIPRSEVPRGSEEDSSTRGCKQTSV